MWDFYEIKNFQIKFLALFHVQFRENFHVQVLMNFFNEISY